MKIIASKNDAGNTVYLSYDGSFARPLQWAKIFYQDDAETQVSKWNVTALTPIYKNAFVKPVRVELTE